MHALIQGGIQGTKGGTRGHIDADRKAFHSEVTEDSISERRLWTAVLVKAIDDWRSGTLRARREAQRFLFEDTRDFYQVCAGAGIDPVDFRQKLLKIGTRISMTGPWLGSFLAQS